MSASLYYIPLVPKRKEYIHVTACQVRQDLNTLYGDYPMVLSIRELPQLKTLRTLWLGRQNDDLMDEDPYGEIIKLVEKHPDGIELFEES